MARPNNTTFAAWLRGGQTFGHTVAMVHGVFLFIGKWLLIPAICCYVWLQFWATDLELQYGFTVLQARLFEWFGSPAPDVLSVPVPGSEREIYHVSDIPHLPFVRPLADAYFAKFKLVFVVWFFAATSLISLQAFLFTTSGKAKLKTRQVKGQEVVSATKLLSEVRDFNAKVAKERGLPPPKPLSLVGLDYPHDGEFEHTMITGGIGSGKSVAIKRYLASLRERGDRAIIYDPEGEYIRDFYDPSIDVILNPFDDRSPSWSPFFDATEQVEWDRLAHGIFKEPKSGDPYWTQVARDLFSWTSYALQKRWPNATLHDALNLFFGPSDNLKAILGDTPAAKHLEGAGQRTSSLESMLTQGTTPLVYLLTQREPFSIKKWINYPERRPGFLFLSAPESHIATMRPLLGFWSDIAISSILTRMATGVPPIPTHIILDEFPTLGRVDSLAEGPARLRKHGGAMLFGLQQVSQLKDIYGTERALTIIGQCTNKLVLRANDPDTAKTMSLMLGERVMHRVTEATTYGANTVRDGVGITPKEEKEPVFSPTQIMNFPALQGVVKLSNRRPSRPFPIATVKFTPLPLPPLAEPFIALTGPSVVDRFMNRNVRRSNGAQTTRGAAAAATHAKALNAGAAEVDTSGGGAAQTSGGGRQASLTLVVDNDGKNVGATGKGEGASSQNLDKAPDPASKGATLGTKTDQSEQSSELSVSEALEALVAEKRDAEVTADDDQPKQDRAGRGTKGLDLDDMIIDGL